MKMMMNFIKNFVKRVIKDMKRNQKIIGIPNDIVQQSFYYKISMIERTLYLNLTKIFGIRKCTK